MVTLLVRPLGICLTGILTDQRTLLDPALGLLERVNYRLTRVDPRRQMGWRE